MSPPLQSARFLKLTPLLIAGLAVVLFAWHFIKPGPPSAITISAGAQGGAYFEYAKKYATALEKNGVKVTVLTSSGSIENINRLKEQQSANKRRQDSVDVAFVQSGLVDEASKDGLISLGSLYYEPVWVFYNTRKWPYKTEPINHLLMLKGHKVNTGGKGSGTEKLALELLANHGLSADSITGSSLDPSDAAAALKGGSIDAMLLVAAASAPVVKDLFSTSGIAVMNLSRADAFTRLMPALSKVVLPRGSISLEKDIPSSDIQSVASTATLVATDDLHPAISYLLIKTAQELHSGPQLLSAAREFPSITKYQEFEVPDEINKLYSQGAPILYKYMPFWLANLLYRLWVLIIPLGAALITFSDALPKILGFQGNRQIASIYRSALRLERQAMASKDPAEANGFFDQITALQTSVSKIRLPKDFVKSLFELQGHLDQVRGSVKAHFDSLSS